MATNHFENGLYRSPSDRPARHISHLRRAYEAAGLDVPVYLTETVDERLRSLAGKSEAEAAALLVEAVEDGNPDVAEKAAALFAQGAAVRAGAERATQTLVATKLAALPGFRERAARDLNPALQAAAEELGRLGQNFDPQATTSLDPATLGTQRQYDGLKVLGEVESALRLMGRLTLLSAPGVHDAARADDLVMKVEYDENAEPETPVKAVWLTPGSRSMVGRAPEWDTDVYLLAAASGWLGSNATVTWRLRHR